MKIQLEHREIDILEALDDRNVKTGVVHECLDECGQNFYEVDTASEGFAKFKSAAMRASVLWKNDEGRMAVLKKLSDTFEENGMELPLYEPDNMTLPKLTKEELENHSDQPILPFDKVVEDLFRSEGAQIISFARSNMRNRHAEFMKTHPRAFQDTIKIKFEIGPNGKIKDIKIMVGAHDEAFLEEIKVEFSKLEFPLPQQGDRTALAYKFRP